MPRLNLAHFDQNWHGYGPASGMTKYLTLKPNTFNLADARKYRRASRDRERDAPLHEMLFASKAAFLNLNQYFAVVRAS